MKASKVLVAISFFVATALALPAQQKYATAELEDIGQLLKKKPMAHIEEIDSQTMEVTHLGLPVFFQESKYPYSLLFRFVERISLYAKLLDVKERNLLLSDNKVKMDLSKVSAIDPTTEIKVNSNESSFTISWNGGEISFPKDFHLISGMNKKESDAFFHKQLMAYCSSNQKQVENRIPVAVPTDSASYVVDKGDYYIVREMNSNRYYLNLGNDKLCPLYSEKYASESVVNLFQELLRNNFTIDINQNIYNYKRLNYTLPLSTFTNYCKSEGCRTYVGIESENDTTVKAAVVYRNDFFEYNHLLYVEIDRKTLREQKGSFKGILYCYIPTHNLKNLFQDGK